MVTSCRISKIANGAGKYSCQYVRNGKVNICCFNSFEDCVEYACDIWELTKVSQDLTKSIVLVKD